LFKIGFVHSRFEDRNRSFEALLVVVFKLKVMELARLKNTKHARLNLIADVIYDHGSFSLMNEQHFNAKVGMESLFMLVVFAFTSIGKVQGRDPVVACNQLQFASFFLVFVLVLNIPYNPQRSVIFPP